MPETPHRAVTQLYDDLLHPSGLRSTQFSPLTVIRLTGTARIMDLAHAFRSAAR
jgi:hypothetical protein